jgi:hypothetical protein
MINHLDINVVWTPTRTVTVHVVIEPDLHGADEDIEKVEEDELLFEPTIDREDLDSRLTLASRLEEITRPEADGGTVEALCLELNLAKLLDVLGVTGSPPPLIPFPLIDG